MGQALGVEGSNDVEQDRAQVLRRLVAALTELKEQSRRYEEEASGWNPKWQRQTVRLSLLRITIALLEKPFGLVLFAVLPLSISLYLLLFPRTVSALLASYALGELIAALTLIGGGVAWIVRTIRVAEVQRDKDEQRSREEAAARAGRNRDKARKATKVLVCQLASLSDGIDLFHLEQHLRQTAKLDDPFLLAEAMDELLCAGMLTVKDGRFYLADKQEPPLKPAA